MATNHLSPVSSLSTVARWEWGLLLFLCLASTIFWLLLYHPFVLPNPDFPSFERAARSLWQGELPSSFKRMPLFPLLIGGVAELLPVDRPILHAGLIVNIGFSVGILLLIFVFCRRLVGVMAFVPVMAVMFIPNFHKMALQPLVDPMLTFFVLLSLVLFQRQSLWQYLAAGLAATCRYEASALIAIFFVLNWAREGRLWLHFSLSFVAAAGFLGWLGLSLMQHEMGNPYLSQMAEQSFEIAWSVPGTMLRSFYRIETLDLLVAPLVLAGIIISVVKHRAVGIAIVGFGLLYLAAHMAYGLDRKVYAHPVFWMPPFYVAVTILYLSGFRTDLTSWSTQKRRALLLVVIAMLVVMASFYLAALMELFNTSMFDKTAIFVSYYLAVTAAVYAFFWKTVGRSTRTSFLTAVLLATTFSCLSAISFREGAVLLRKAYYAQTSEYLAMKWLDENMQIDERALVYGTTAMGFTSLKRDQFTSFTDLNAESHEAMLDEMRALNIDYLVYWYRLDMRGKPGTKNYAANLYYYNRYKVYLTEPFRDGEKVPDFELLATLDPPKETMRKVHIYRLIDD